MGILQTLRLCVRASRRDDRRTKGWVCGFDNGLGGHGDVVAFQTPANGGGERWACMSGVLRVVTFTTSEVTFFIFLKSEGHFEVTFEKCPKK